MVACLTIAKTKVRSKRRIGHEARRGHFARIYRSKSLRFTGFTFGSFERIAGYGMPAAPAPSTRAIGSQLHALPSAGQAASSPGGRVDVHTRSEVSAVIRSDDPVLDIHPSRERSRVRTWQGACCADFDALKTGLSRSASLAGQLVLENEVLQQSERHHLLQDGVLALERAGIGDGIFGRPGNAGAHIEAIPINGGSGQCGACLRADGQNLLYSTLLHG